MCKKQNPPLQQDSPVKTLGSDTSPLPTSESTRKRRTRIERKANRLATEEDEPISPVKESLDIQVGKSSEKLRKDELIGGENEED